MSKIFKDLIVLQAEIALLPEGGEFYDVRKALADLVDSVLSLPEYEDVEVTQDSANIIKVEISYGSVKMTSPDQPYEKQDLSIERKFRDGTVTYRVITFTHSDGEVTPLFEVVDEDLNTWLTYPTSHVFHGNGTLCPHYVLYNAIPETVAEMFRNSLRNRITLASGGKSIVLGYPPEDNQHHKFERCAGSERVLKFQTLGGNAWFTTKDKATGKMSSVVYGSQADADNARDYIEDVAKVLKNHELAQKPSYISVENLNDKVKSGEYEIVRQNVTVNCGDSRNFQVATISHKGQPTGVYSYVAMTNKKSGCTLSDRVYAKLTEAINYGGYLNGDR